MKRALSCMLMANSTYTSDVYPSVVGDCDFAQKYRGKGALDGLVVLRDDETNKFHVMKRNYFLSHDATMPARYRHFHEVVFGDNVQRIRFDIDCSVEKLKQISPEMVYRVGALFLEWEWTAEMAPTVGSDGHFDLVYRYIIGQVRKVFFAKYELAAVLQEYKTEHPENGSFSRHIIITNGVLSCHSQVNAFIKYLASQLPLRIQDILDVGVAKSLQNFRLPGHAKMGGQVKKWLADGGTQPNSLAMLVPEPGTLPLKDAFDSVKRRVDIPDVSNAVAAAAIQMFRESEFYDPCHEFRGIRNGRVQFDRTEPSECAFCARIHDRDNTLYISVSADAFYLKCLRAKSQSKYLGSYSASGETVDCRRAEPGRGGGGINTVAAMRVADTAEAWSRGELRRQNQFIATLAPGDCEIYSEPAMRPYPNVKSLIVKAAMKMGKTTQLRPMIEAAICQNDWVPARIVFVSFRQTFSREIKSKFPNFTLYSDVAGPLDQGRLIVQVESLYRLVKSADTVPTILVLDEIESILEQFSSNLSQKIDYCFTAFQWLLEHSGRIIAMDANFSDRSWNTLTRLRPQMLIESKCFVENQYKNATADTVYLHAARAPFLECITNTLSSEESGAVAIVTNSLAQANTIHAYVKRQRPNIKSIVYSSETAKSITTEHFQDVNTFWSEYQCVIFTPTVTAGISFEAHHFNRIFGLFTNVSCSAGTCAQMLGRVRDISEHEIHILYEHAPANVPVTDRDIFEWMNHGYNATMTSCYDPLTDSDARRIFSSRRYAVDGVKFTEGEDSFIDLHIQNMAIRNRSRMNFTHELVAIISEAGAAIVNVDADGYQDMTGNEMFENPDSKVLREDLAEIDQDFRNVADEVRGIIHGKIAAAPDLTEEQAFTIYEKLGQAQIPGNPDVDPDSLVALNKYKLRLEYNKFAGAMTPDFVKRYSAQSAKTIYHNLCAYYSDPSPSVAIEKQRMRDCYAIQFARMDFRPVYGHTTEYRSRRMIFAFRLVCEFGFDGIDDPKSILAGSIIEVLKRGIKDMPILASEWERAPLSRGKLEALSGQPLQYIKYGLAFVNAILNATWGASIASSPLILGAYELKRSKLFAPLGAESESRPVIMPIEEKTEFHFAPTDPSLAAPIITTPVSPEEPRRNAQGMIIGKED